MRIEIFYDGEYPLENSDEKSMGVAFNNVKHYVFSETQLVLDLEKGKNKNKATRAYISRDKILRVGIYN